MSNESKKRISIVTLKLVREKSIIYAKSRITSPGDAASLFRDYMGDLDREHFVLMGLNTKNEPVMLETVHIGSLNASIVHPREVFKSAILSNSAYIMVCHNHPSDDCEPSREDVSVTDRLAQAGDLIGIPLLDHFIIGTEGYVSFKERGYC
ncbi:MULTISPECIES: JAB domain-containing protein [unclassified Exiguobacterium]|uniref:JAB domain-containing protein n=1 Tax=unclassified Exiguobacterium TaxID=2644629 RepID=UPI0025BC575C|nr:MULTISPECIES: JAB domain-containing protein [unclassified Exiguobacterium]